VESLRQLISQDLTIAVVFIRLGLYGIGLFNGERLVSSKVGTGLVHARHRKGGSSQRRFERHRDKQMEYFFTSVCEKSREKLEPFSGQIDCLFYCGEKTTVNSFVKQCSFLRTLNACVMPRLIDIRGHGQRALTEAINKIWSCEVIEWHEPEEPDSSNL
jgi:peptide subunit release factor 1 (eRF1)